MSQSGPRSAESVEHSTDGTDVATDIDSHTDSDSAQHAESLSVVEPTDHRTVEADEAAEATASAENAAGEAAAPGEQTGAKAANAKAEGGKAEDDEPMPTLLEQMGGISGLIYSSVPVLVFVGVYLPSRSLAASIWASVGSAVLILIWRLVRREKIQPAISGLFGVAIAAFIAYKTGSARGYFLFGIWTNVAYGAVFLLSAIIRWPLAGVIWSALNSKGQAWRADPKCRRYYDGATVVWVLVFAARFLVQAPLYDNNQVGWLAFTRLAMGWPLTAVAALVTIWAVRKADKRQKELEPAEETSAPAA